MSFSIVTLSYSPRLKATFATFHRGNRAPRCRINPTPASIARLSATIIKMQAKVSPSLIGSVGWFATFRESEVKK